MSYRVDPKTHLFDDLTTAEAADLHAVIRNNLYQGDTYQEHPAYRDWCEARGYGEPLRVGNVTLPPSFPTYALLSLLARPGRIDCVAATCLRCSMRYPVDLNYDQGECARCLHEYARRSHEHG